MPNPSANHFSSKYPYSKIRGGKCFLKKKDGKSFSKGQIFRKFLSQNFFSNIRKAQINNSKIKLKSTRKNVRKRIF